jgi:hypothetical protein
LTQNALIFQPIQKKIKQTNTISTPQSTLDQWPHEKNLFRLLTKFSRQIREKLTKIISCKKNKNLTQMHQDWSQTVGPHQSTKPPWVVGE